MPGTGFAFELQHRKLAGAYFGFDEQGEPVWYVFSGELREEAAGDQVVGYVLDSQLIKLAGGQCLGCDYVAPVQAGSELSLRIQFLGRTSAIVNAGDAPPFRIRPRVYGVAVSGVFSDSGVDQIADLNGPWVLAFQDVVSLSEAGSRYSFSVNAVADVDEVNGKYGALFSVSSADSPETVPVATLQCERQAPRATCFFTQSYDRDGQPINPAKRYDLSVDDIADGRFKAIATDGETVEGFRLDHD